MRVASRPTQQSQLKDAMVPAPVGGINSVDPGSGMPPTDCVYLFNMYAGELGLRVRLGQREWITGLDGPVRSGIPFQGSQSARNRLFFTTFSGIWDCSNSTAAPVRVVAFPVTSGDAGRGISCVFPTPAGHFLFYCDEENGLYLYKESTDLWTKIVAGTTQVWQPTTLYATGNKVTNGGNTYTATAGGTSAAGAGPAGVGAGIGDGTVTWTGVAGVTANAIGPSLGDQNSGISVDPANFVFCMVWENRLCLVEKHTTRFWYLPVYNLLGTATSFQMGSRFQAGGFLVGLWPWSYDAGNGMETRLVGISSSADVVIYGGADITSASSFGIQGVWSVSAVPTGREIATKYGGDLLVLSHRGPVSLSQLVVGQPVVNGERSTYDAQKIAPVFAFLAQTYSGVQGWGVCLHPQENALLVRVPQISDAASTQFAMSFAKKGSWSQLRDMPMTCATPWQGKLYFGTADGRIILNDGYVDGVKLSDPNAYAPVLYSGLSAFQSMGSMRQKQIQFIQPEVLSDTPNALVQATAKYDLDSSEPAPPSGALSNGASAWDAAKWDSALWGGENQPSMPIQGGFGAGRRIAIAFQGKAISKTILTGFAVAWSEWGIL